MQSPTLYTVLSHLDAPIRFLTLTIDELVVILIGLMMLVLSSHKFMVGVFGCMLYMGLKYLKGGAGPRHLLVLAYWYFPYPVTQLFLPTLPASHLRAWVA